MERVICRLGFALIVCFVALHAAWAADDPAAADPTAHSAGDIQSPTDGRPRWLSDYGQAMAEAERRQKMLLIHFCGSAAGDRLCRHFDATTLCDARVQQRLKDSVCVRLPVDTTIRVSGKSVVLLNHPAFREMLGRPGVAMVDFLGGEAELHGRVVSTFPLTRKLQYPFDRMLAILDLPRGTLTQRTLIYAVRTHADRAASANGRPLPYLMQQATSHSAHQARIRNQGHHNWESRFHRINARLPRGSSACEVCAESWPGEHLAEAAVECVRCWRLSHGHWRAVRSYHPFFGYDMRRGKNGVWYATGIFGGK